MREKRQRKNVSRIVISIVLAAVLLGCAGIFVGKVLRQKQAEDTYQTLREESRNEGKTAEAGKTESETPEELKETEAIPYEGIPDVDFAKVRETNGDICAWITMPGTVIDYPILRNGASSDPHDTYYLDTTVDGVSGLPGSIYMEPCNSPEFTDFNTLIYGHDMKNGTMFAGLHQLADDSFFAEHEYVYVITPEKILVYRIFGLVYYDDRHIMMNFDFTQEGQRQAFLDSLYANRDMRDKFREGVEATADSRMITLSTCIGNESTKRLLTEAVLIDEYER